MELDRTPWEEAFTEIGYSVKAMREMDIETFKQTCKFIISSGIAARFVDDDVIALIFCDAIDTPLGSPQQCMPSSLASEVWATNFTSEDISRVYDGGDIIRRNQDSEYHEAEREMDRRERAQRQKQKEEDKRAKARREEDERLAVVRSVMKSAVVNLARGLGDEPEDGVPVAVNLPSRRRIVRKFSVESLGEDVYTWVAGEDEMFQDDLTPLKFELRRVLGQILERDKTLDEQKLQVKFLLNVAIL